MRRLSKVAMALNSTGLPWEVVEGRRHKKIRLNGRLVGIIPKVGVDSSNTRAMLNVLAQIRRAGAH